MDKLETIVRTDIEPGVIDMKIIREAIKEQGPKGEAEVLIEQEGYDIKEVTHLRLEFLNILKIDHLWMLPALTKLQLGNNIIRKIENLDSLVNLKQLDLSFNNIKVIENLDKLVNIEILTLFNNWICELKNLENLTKLRIFSIGNNFIEDAACVMYLRQFTNLKSLNMAGNPCAEKTEFRIYIAAYIPQLVYYEYKLITSEEGIVARQAYIKDLEILEREEANIKKQISQQEELIAKEVLHSEAFVEQLDGDQLYDALFEKDEEGQAFLSMGEEAEELYITFRQQFGSITSEIFELGQKQLKLRKEEIEQFQNCMRMAKEKSQKQSQKIMETFLGIKAETIFEMKKIISTTEGLEKAMEKVVELTAEFNKLCHTTWKQLMNLELSLFEQVEELNTNFERNLGDMINTFIETAQGFFTQLRDHENSFSEALMDQAVRFLSHLTMRNEDISSLPPPMRVIMVDKEAINNAVASSHDIHLQIIDNREDLLISKIRTWHLNLCTGLQYDEITRNRTTIMEINYFLDVQREEYEQFQSSLELDDLYSGSTPKSTLFEDQGLETPIEDSKSSKHNGLNIESAQKM